MWPAWWSLAAGLSAEVRPLQGRRDEDVGGDREPERNHPRLGFGARAALIAWSICREVSLSVPFRRDSSPIAFSTSGSGPASRT